MREFLMLAKIYKGENVRGWWMSEKLDGQRCFWDGGISRGRLKREVPWANTLKDDRYKEEVVCTGLWSRYGNVIHAPGWWLDSLPEGVLLDGELYLGRGRFQECRKIVSTLVPGEGWNDVEFHVFESPPFESVFKSGEIKGVNFKKIIDMSACKDFYGSMWNTSCMPFWRVISTCDWISVNQKEVKNVDDIFCFLDKVVAGGGEGLMLRDGTSFYSPKRSNRLLKVKPFDEDVGVVVGFNPGVGKYSGMMGSLVVDWNGIRFDLSGFTDAQRELNHEGGCDFVGRMVRFRYVSLTNSGVPREARYCAG